MMKFTAAEIRDLSAGNSDQGWLPIPHGCPPQFVQMILETRARRSGLREEFAAPVIPVSAPSVPEVDVEALRARLQELSI